VKFLLRLMLRKISSTACVGELYDSYDYRWERIKNIRKNKTKKKDRKKRRRIKRKMYRKVQNLQRKYGEIMGIPGQREYVLYSSTEVGISI
jgi:hypothetical protein